MDQQQEQNVSKIIRARELMMEAAAKRSEAQGLIDEAEDLLRAAFKMMHREPSVRRARQAKVTITDDMREQIKSVWRAIRN